MRRFLKNYALRHQHRGNQVLHVAGLPVTFVLPVIFLVEHQPSWAGACFIVGYVLQFAGHAIEGNDAGEVILVKRMLGMPYIDIVDRPNRSSEEG
ncbi:MAG: DUF962 domain-containing protein [Planctomycetaceae bacterium]|nr:DUF962 domain-containing protein [Planctomycetaceae bacterium]